jgi:hypothetical protein
MSYCLLSLIYLNNIKENYQKEIMDNIDLIDFSKEKKKVAKKPKTKP